MGSDIKRPAYTAHEASDVAQAANLIAAEARAADRTVRRPFSGSTLEGRPTWTAAHSVMWWHVDQERARDRAHDAERDALRTRAEAAEAALAAARAEVAQARADARVLVGQMWAVDEQLYTEDVLVPAGLTATEVNAVRDSYDHTLPVAEVVAVIRRALGGAA